MLNKSERFKALRFLRFCCVIGLLPTQVEVANWELKVPSITKQCVCAVSYGCYILHTLYKNVTFVYAYFFVSDVQLHQLIIHAALAIASTMCGFWYYVVYIKDPTLLAMYVKATLTGNTGGPTDTKDQLNKKWTTRMREYSVQDLVAMGMPYMVGLAVPIVCTSYVYDSSMRLLLFSALPCHLQNWATFALLLFEEARLLMMLATITAPIYQHQIISFDLVCKQLLMLKKTIQSDMECRWNVYRSLRRLQLYVSMLNEVNSYLIYTWKLVSISVCIVCGYAAIAHFGEHPIFGVMYYFLLFDCSFIYTVIYEKAFKVPQLFDQAASCALLRSRRNQSDAFRRRILSIRRTGIRVGNFHQMERASTLIFMNYVVTHIVSMLVACR